MIFKKLNDMKKRTAVLLAAVLLAACIGDVYYTHRVEIKAMQDEGAARLLASVDTGLYREPEKEKIEGILADAEAAIRESEDQSEIDALIEEAVAGTAGFKTDAIYASEEEGVEKLKSSIDPANYRDAEQKEIKKILDSTEKAILESEDQAEIDKLIEKAVAEFAAFKTDAEYTAEEEAAAAAAAAARQSRQKSKKKKSSSSRGCVGTGADVFN